MSWDIDDRRVRAVVTQRVASPPRRRLAAWPVKAAVAVGAVTAGIAGLAGGAGASPLRPGAVPPVTVMDGGGCVPFASTVLLTFSNVLRASPDIVQIGTGLAIGTVGALPVPGEAFAPVASAYFEAVDLMKGATAVGASGLDAMRSAIEETSPLAAVFVSPLALAGMEAAAGALDTLGTGGALFGQFNSLPGYGAAVIRSAERLYCVRPAGERAPGTAGGQGTEGLAGTTGRLGSGGIA